MSTCSCSLRPFRVLFLTSATAGGRLQAPRGARARGGCQAAEHDDTPKGPIFTRGAKMGLEVYRASRSGGWGKANVSRYRSNLLWMPYTAQRQDRIVGIAACARESGCAPACPYGAQNSAGSEFITPVARLSRANLRRLSRGMAPPVAECAAEAGRVRSPPVTARRRGADVRTYGCLARGRPRARDAVTAQAPGDCATGGPLGSCRSAHRAGICDPLEPGLTARARPLGRAR
jgi:hypothetical protein